MSYENLTYEVRDDVAVIGLNRPDKRNALNDALVLTLQEAVLRAGEEARAGVIFGHGEHFCAGLDLAESRERRAAGVRRPLHHRIWHICFDHIARGRIPFVSALHGATVGGGMELACATHVRVADASTYFALPEATRGIFVGGGGSVRITRVLGYPRMADMMLTGRVLSAEEGERHDLAHYVVPEGQALDKALSLASRIAENAPLSNYAITNGLARIQDMSHDDGLFVETLVSEYTTSPESVRRLTEFVEKKTARVAPSDPAAGDDA